MDECKINSQKHETNAAFLLMSIMYKLEYVTFAMR